MRAIRNAYLRVMVGLTLGLLLLTPAAAQPGGDPPLWKMNLELDPAAGSLQGELQLPLSAGSHQFELMDPLAVSRITAGELALEVIPMGHGRYRLDIPAAAAGEVLLHWRGVMPEGDPQRSRQFLTRDGGFLPEGPAWYPRFEQNSFALRLEGRTPAGQRFVATGSLLATPTPDGPDYAAVYEHPGTDRIVVATGPWEARERWLDGVRIRTLFPAHLDQTHAENYLDHTVEYLRLFGERAGPYPYESFTIAASPMPVGYAFPGFTLLGERVIPLPFIPRTSLAHELMHSWWGTGVRVDYDTGNWSEALTTYMADYFLDTLRGEAADTRHRWLLDLAWLPETLDRPLATFRSGNQGANRIVGYNRGAMLFRMLEERIGSAAFNAGARLLNERHMFRVASWEDLTQAFSDASDQELSTFIGPWLNRAGLPELSLQSVSVEAVDGGWAVRGVLKQEQDDAPWPLRVPIEIETATGSKREVIALEDRRAQFRVLMDAQPHAVTADPHFEILRRLPDPPPILRTVTLDPETRLIALQEGLEPFARSLLGFLPEPAEDYTADEPRLVIGSTSAVVHWLNGVGAATAPLDLAESGHARMWTLPGTRTVIISTGDGTGLNNLVRALRHHGHRSYLVQDADGRTVSVGVWESPSTPLRVDLPLAPG